MNVNQNGLKVKMDLEEYITGVVACEMPALFHDEALKAMSIASRTFALYKANDSEIEMSKNDQCFSDVDVLKQKWGNDFEKYYNKIKSLVEETKGKYIAYLGNPIEAFYFSTSNGYTENSQNVFSEERDYLVSVTSPWDLEANTYYKKKEIAISEFLEKLKIDSVDKIEIISRYDTNRIKEIRINDKVYSGIDIRKILDLRSTDFEIKKEGNKIIIKTYGYGHGVGMSQYGANGMAKEGYSYDEIIKYYYKYVEILDV